MNYNLELYRQMFISLKRGNTRGVFSNAKPVLLLSIIDNVKSFEENKILWGDISINSSYSAIYQQINDTKPTPIWKPFFYLKSEPFYELIWTENLMEKDLKFPSGRLLSSYLAYAKLDDELWELLQDEGNREYLKDVIIKTYLS